MKRRTVRRLVWVGVALTLVALVFGVVFLFLHPDRPPAIFSQVKPGMTLAQVEAIIGRPCDHDTRGMPGPQWWVWVVDEGISTFTVYVDTDGRAARGEWFNWGTAGRFRSHTLFGRAPAARGQPP